VILISHIASTEEQEEEDQGDEHSWRIRYISPGVPRFQREREREHKKWEWGWVGEWVRTREKRKRKEVKKTKYK
jgi:hypothetical protein